jgi:hypothetical protein
MGFIDSCQPIDEPLKRAKDTIGKGTFPLKNAGHVETQRLCAKQDQCKEEKNLKPAVRCHDEYFLLKLFGAQQRVHQINEQSHCYKTKCQRFDHLCVSFAPSRSHPMAYPIAMQKNNMLATTQPISHMILPPAKRTRLQNVLRYFDQSWSLQILRRCWRLVFARIRPFAIQAVEA